MFLKRISLRRVLLAISIVATILLILKSFLGMALPAEIPVEQATSEKQAKIAAEKAPELDLPKLDPSRWSEEMVVHPGVKEELGEQPLEFGSMELFKPYQLKIGEQVFGTVKLGQSRVDEPVITLYQRENATFFSLVRNLDFQGMIKAVQSVEQRFNHIYHYDWVFANDQPFTQTFMDHMTDIVSGTAHFVQIPEQYWLYPEFIDVEKAERTRDLMKKQKIKYGDSENYRHMCRFNSGLFFKLPIMQKYRYYWRVEPDIEFNCDLFETDWFKYMRQNKKKYAFVLSPLELHTTVRNIWRTTKQFIDKFPEHVHPNNTLAFLTDDDMKNFNMCHFWSNFEIGDMDFFRLEAYQAFFDFFDRVGGFYYSRWGDAPVHSIGVAMLLLGDEVYHLQDSGYFHHPNGDCPRDDETRRARRCSCNIKNEHTWSQWSCIPKWYEVNGLPKPAHSKTKVFRNRHRYVRNQDKDPFRDW